MSIKTLFEDIADAIREKSGSSDTYTPAEMPSAIRSIPSGSSTASGVSYDNTSSGLTASNVQDAIDELSGDVSTIDSDLSEFDNNLEFITLLGYNDTTTPKTITLSDSISNYRWLYVALVLNDNHYAPTFIPTIAITTRQFLISAYDGSSNHYGYFNKTSDTTIYCTSDSYTIGFWGIGKK